MGALKRIPEAIARGATAFWGSLSDPVRAHLGLALGAVVALVILFAAVVPALPCEAPGGDTCAPADDAEDLVPADVLAYVHADADSATDQYAAAVRLRDDLPILGSQIVSRALALIPGPGSEPVDFADDVEPWFGGELAIAVLPASPRPQRVDLFEIDDPAGASAYADALAIGTSETSDYEGVEISVDQRDVASAQVEGFLAVGTEDGVRAVIATATGADEAASLSQDPIASTARDQLPDQTFADAWISADGIDDLIADDRGVLGTLSPLFAPASSRGAAISLSAGDGELELAVRSSLDPQLEQDSPSFFAAFPAFTPELPQQLASDTLGYIGIGAPASTVTALLSQAAAGAPGIADAFRRAVAGLERRGDLDVQGDLLDSLGDEAALALEPPPSNGDEGGVSVAGLPYALFAARGVDEDAAREALAALQRPLASGVDAGSGGQAPVFGQQEVSGVETNSLRISPTVELTYAVFDGIAAVATDPAGVAALIAGEGGLADLTLYKDATDGFGEQVSLQAYLDLAGLVQVGEQAGLAEDPLYATFAGDFRRLESFAVAVSIADDVLATDARLTVGELTSPATDD